MSKKNRRATPYRIEIAFGSETGFHELPGELFNQYAEEAYIVRSVHNKRFAHVAPGYIAKKQRGSAALEFLPIPIPNEAELFEQQQKTLSYHPGPRIMCEAKYAEPHNEWLYDIEPEDNIEIFDKITHPVTFCHPEQSRAIRAASAAGREAA